MSSVRIRRCVLSLVMMLTIALAHARQDTETDTPGPAPTPQSAGQLDLTGYWVSIVTQDWLYRMVTPEKGDHGSVPLNAAGLKAANEWDAALGSASCKAHGAAGVMRLPGRLHISWENASTLRIDLDAGTQTRFLHFAEFLPASGFGTSQEPMSLLRFQAPPGPPTLQGYSIAAWKKVAQVKGLTIVGLNVTPPPTPHQGGALIAMTTNMEAGYLQKNGIPYSADALMTEYFNRIKLPNGDDYLILTSIVEDPMYLSEPFVTSTQFKREVDNSRWSPTPCDPS